MTSQPGFVERVEARLRKFSEEHWGIYADSDAYSIGLVRQALTEIMAESGPVEIDWPTYHPQAMGCGLEDRSIHDRYEAMQYGWDQAVERCQEAMPDPLFTHPAPSELAEAHEQVEREHAETVLQGVERALEGIDYKGTYADGVQALRSQLAAAQAALSQIRAIVDLQRDPHWAYRNTVTAKREAIRDLIDTAISDQPAKGSAQ